MNNHFKLILAGLLCFIMGVLSTLLYKFQEKDNSHSRRRLFTSSSIGISEKKQSHAHNPLENISLKNKKIIENKKIEEVDIERLNFFELTSELEKVRTKVYDQVGREYKRVDLSDKKNAKNKALLESRLRNYKLNQTQWLKATAEDLNNKFKLYLYLNLYNCDKDYGTKLVEINIKNLCYSLVHIIKHDGKINETSNFSSIDFLSWKDNVPYIRVSTESIEGFSKDTMIFTLLVPVLTESGTLQVLKLIDDNIIREEDVVVNWERSSSQEFEKFNSSSKEKLLQDD